MSRTERLIAKSLMVVAPLAGRVSLLLFVVFLFRGPLGLIKMGLSETTVLAWDGILSMVFFMQHSGMIRRRFRSCWSRFFPSQYNNAVFSIVSSLVLTGVILLWQPSAKVLYAPHGFLRWMAEGIFVMGLAGIAWGVLALKSFDPFGRNVIKDHLLGTPPQFQQFSMNGPYLWVRHPLYFFVLLLIWSCPALTVDRLIFNILWTVWIYMGTIFEEKDLIIDFGDAYRQYQRKVPMLIPWRGRATG